MPIIEKSHNPYTNAIVTLVFAILVVGAAAFFLILPLSSQRSQNMADLATRRAATEKIHAQNLEAKQAFADLTKNQDVINRVDYALPAKPFIPDLLAHLETLIKASDLTAGDIKIADPFSDSATLVGTLATSNVPNMKVIPITIPVTGSYNSVGQFLSSLEQSLVLLDVQKIQVSVDKSSTDLSFVLTLNTYYYQK